MNETSKQAISRRVFLRKVTHTSITLVGAGAMLAGCKKDSNAQNPTTPNTPPTTSTTQCDATKLNQAEQKTRTTLKYVDQTPIPQKRCDNCKLFIPGKPCGGCTMVKGPIKPEGYCVAWVKLPA